MHLVTFWRTKHYLNKSTPPCLKVSELVTTESALCILQPIPICWQRSWKPSHCTVPCWEPWPGIHKFVTAHKVSKNDLAQFFITVDSTNYFLHIFVGNCNEFPGRIGMSFTKKIHLTSLNTYCHTYKSFIQPQCISLDSLKLGSLQQSGIVL